MDFEEWFYKKKNHLKVTDGVYENAPNSIYIFGMKVWIAAQTEKEMQMLTMSEAQVDYEERLKTEGKAAERKKFKKKLIQYIQSEWSEQEIAESWQEFLKEEIKPFYPYLYKILKDEKP